MGCGGDLRSIQARFVGSHPITARVAPGHRWALDLIALLSDGDLYRDRLLGIKKLCEFDAGMAMRFRGPEGDVEVLLCFTCGEFMVNGRGVGQRGDFDSRARAFVALARRAFPGHGVIRGVDRRPGQR